MKKIALSIIMLVSAVIASANVIIGDKTYQSDTLFRRQVGPGMITTIIRLPDYPLNIYVTEVDLNNPNNRVETTIGNNVVYVRESLIDAMVRNRTATKRPLVACNSNFWCVSTQIPYNEFELNVPFGSVVRNDSIYVNAETNEDEWSYGPGYTGGTAISRDKTLYLNHIIPRGTISGEKIETPIEFNTVNRRCMLNHITLWTRAYNRSRNFATDWINVNTHGDTYPDNYYLKLKPGSRWGINCDMEFIVSKIVKDADRQKLGEYDACLTCSGDKKGLLGVLEEGDEITINYGMFVGGDPNNRPEIENMVEGIGLVMLDGQLTNNNYDDYNSKVYSRTGYGASADGKRLILIVIDNSQSKKYGRSQGCSTETMCHILKSLCPYVSNVNSMDAGGSAMMIVDGECINNTIEGNPRTVACGWMVEAFGEEDYEIASIAFDDWKIESPTYSSYTPRILGYNKLGELIDKDVKGFTLSCDEALGATQGDTFIAGSESMQGTLTATLNGMTATLPVTTIIAQPTIKIKPNLLIDNRSYPIEVIANVGDKTYTYDSSKFNWSVDDETIAGITDGVLKAVKNGKTRFECAIGPYVESDSLTVEISDTPYIYQPWDDAWTIKGSGAKNFTLGEDGTLNYTYSGSRAPYISLKKDLTFYSLPDTIALTFNSSLPIEYIQIDMRNAAFSSVNYMKYEIEGGFLAGQDYTVKVDLGALGGTRDISTYPLYLKEIKIVPDKSLATNGEHTLALKSLYSHYRDMDAPLLGDVNGDGEIDVKDVTALITYILGDIPEDFVIENANVNGEGEIDVQDVTAIINIILR